MALITKEQAFTHLRVDGAEYDADIELKMEQATAHVLTYLKIDADALADLGWTDETDPASDTTFAITQGAILEVLANIFFDRGDRDKPSDGPITPRIKNALSMLRDPALA
jgi:hypothetical protein